MVRLSVAVFMVLCALATRAQASDAEERAAKWAMKLSLAYKCSNLPSFEGAYEKVKREFTDEIGQVATKHIKELELAQDKNDTKYTADMCSTLLPAVGIDID